MPDAKGILAVHDACYRIHRELLEKCGMNCGQQFGQQMSFCSRLLLQVNYGQQDFLNRFTTAHLEETNKNIRRKIFRFYGGYGAGGGIRTHVALLPN